MSEQENRGALERYRQVWFESQDIDAAADLLHDDYVEEYPNQARGFGARTTREPYTRTIRAYRTCSTTASG
jgi:hypothetical protein